MPRKRSSDRNVPFASNPLLRVKLPAYRSQIMMLFVAIAFVALAARAVWLQVFSQDFLQKQGESRYARTIELPAMISSRPIMRTSIFDMLPSRCLPPVECWRGARPSQAAKSRPLRNISIGGPSARSYDVVVGGLSPPVLIT